MEPDDSAEPEAQRSIYRSSPGEKRGRTASGAASLTRLEADLTMKRDVEPRSPRWPDHLSLSRHRKAGRRGHGGGLQGGGRHTGPGGGAEIPARGRLARQAGA